MKAIHFSTPILALALMALLCQKPDQLCTQIGCGDTGLSITFPDLKPGIYNITVLADVQRFERNCTAEVEKTIENEETQTVMHSGGPCSVQITGRFKSVTVFLEKRKLGTYSVQYEPYFPNGRDCPGVCEGASLSISTDDIQETGH